MQPEYSPYSANQDAIVVEPKTLFLSMDFLGCVTCFGVNK
jgi:hypothetical protein